MFTVSVEVCAAVPLRVTDAGLSEQVGRSLAPLGDAVSAHFNPTLPLNP